MIYKFIALVVILLALLLASGDWQAEGTLRGFAIGGALAIKTGRRTVALSAHPYRPNRTFYYLIAR